MTDHSLSADTDATATAQLEGSRDTETTELTFRLGSEPPIEGYAIERGAIGAQPASEANRLRVRALCG